MGDSWRAGGLGTATLLGVGVVLWVFLAQFPPWTSLEEETVHWRYLARGSLPPATPPVVYVAIDERTVTFLGERPWDRGTFAKVAEIVLEDAEAAAIGFDIVFSPLTHSSLVDSRKAQAGDHALGEIIRRHPERIVLGAAYTGARLPYLRKASQRPNTIEVIRDESAYPEMPTYPVIDFDYGFTQETPDYLTGRIGLIATVTSDTTRGLMGPLVVSTAYEGPAHIWNLAYGLTKLDPAGELSRSESGCVFTSSEEGVSRTFPASVEQRFWSFGLMLYLAVNGFEDDVFRLRGQSLRIAPPEGEEFDFPLATNTTIAANWPRSWAEQTVVSLVDVLAIRQHPNDPGTAETREKLRGAAVIVAPADPLLGDLTRTPVDASLVPAASVHGALYETISENRPVTTPGPTGWWLASLLPACAVLLGGSFRGKWGWLANVAGATLGLGYLGLAFGVFFWQGALWPIVAPMGGVLGGGAGLIVAAVLRKERQRRRVKRLFGTYLAPTVVESMVEQNMEPILGGESRHVTAFFSDIQGFSRMAAKMTPHELVDLMNDYFTAATDVIQAEGGTLDKYVGDGIVAIFGAPVELPDNPTAAIRAALALQEAQDEVRDRWCQRLPQHRDVLSPMRSRAGVAVGDALVGNFGSEKRFNYTMMGPSPIYAARCEQWGKDYGAFVLATEETILAAGGEEVWLYRILESRRASPDSEPVPICEVFGLRKDVPDDWLKLCELFAEGCARMREGRFAEAIAIFETTRPLEPHQPDRDPGVYRNPSQAFRNRCQRKLESGAETIR